ncbi:E3 ubiquitin-protein ligase COP1-like [Amphibalanus amphitrite]|uniref:E3 ubiquitin-protein ligase COP1-like n=1 Tax=Amphibalanus amphitrite TaxID=1232801 RepID=UPI001C90B3A1|nr:E3 ubiquitin-protein ligase COP1-like [Amphibalanus amphitrite]
MSGGAAGAGRPGPSKGRRTRSRGMTGVASSFQKQSEDFLCPICFDVIEEAMMTRCGHTFCNRCIVQSIQLNGRCPKCSRALDEDSIYPNFLLNELVTKHRRARRTPAQLSRLEPAELKEYLVSETAELGLPNVNLMLELLQTRRRALEADSQRTQNVLLREFLTTLRRQREEMLQQLQRELQVIDTDQKRVEQALDGERRGAAGGGDGAAAGDAAGVPCVPSMEAERGALPTESVSPDVAGPVAVSDGEVPEGFNVVRGAVAQTPDSDALARRRRQVHSHFDDLVKCYFSLRPRAVHLGAGGEEGDACPLDSFSDALSRLTRYSGMRPLASLNYSSDLVAVPASSPASSSTRTRRCSPSPASPKDQDLRLRVRGAKRHRHPLPTLEMACTSKISCVAWNGYHSRCWRAPTTREPSPSGTRPPVRSGTFYQEHEKRCWSVDLQPVDTNLIASGSDDFTSNCGGQRHHSILRWRRR